VRDYMPTSGCASASQEADKRSQVWQHSLLSFYGYVAWRTLVAHQSFLQPMCPMPDRSGRALRAYLDRILFLRTILVQTPRTILLYGHDELLLMTRARVLERAGFRTSMACALREIPQLLDQLRPDLLLLCHSLSRTECVVAGMVAKNHRAELRTLLMVSDSCIGARDYGMSEVADEIFNLLLDPEKLVAKVRSMFEGQPQSRLRIPYRQGLSSLVPTS
jgi:hypothetical protein